MKPANKYLRLGTASLLATAAVGTASAAIPAVTASFFVSGASAAREIPKAIGAEFCDPGVNDRADYQYTTKPNDYTITVCTYLNAAPVPTALRGKKIAIFTRAAGGTLFGVRGIAVPQKIKFIDGSTCPADDLNPGTVQNCPDLLAGADYDANPANPGRIPDVGISDEDPKFACKVAAENGPTQCTAAELTGIANTAKFKSQPSYQVIWTNVAGNRFGDTTLASQTVTNIRPEVLAAVYSGGYTSLGQVKQAMGVATVAADFNRGLLVCRRTNTSGTQAGQAQLWTGANYCGSTDSYGFVDATYDDNNVANGFPADYKVVENGSSGDVASCVAGTLAGVSTAADLDRTIGIDALENAPKAGSVRLPINGVTASQQNASSGQYPWYHESTVQYNTDTQGATAVPAALDTTLATRATVAERTAFNSLFVTSVRTASRIKAAGLDGVLGIPGAAGNVPDAVWNANNPVGKTTKLGANCRTPKLVFP